MTYLIETLKVGGYDITSFVFIIIHNFIYNILYIYIPIQQNFKVTTSFINEI